MGEFIRDEEYYYRALRLAERRLQESYGDEEAVNFWAEEVEGCRMRLELFRRRFNLAKKAFLES